MLCSSNMSAFKRCFTTKKPLNASEAFAYALGNPSSIGVGGAQRTCAWTAAIAAAPIPVAPAPWGADGGPKPAAGYCRTAPGGGSCPRAAPAICGIGPRDKMTGMAALPPATAPKGNGAAGLPATSAAAALSFLAWFTAFVSALFRLLYTCAQQSTSPNISPDLELFRK